MAKKTYTKENPTKCCPKFSPKGWDKSKVVWKNKKFIKESTFNIFHIPINMGPVMKKLWQQISAAKASPPTDEWLLLSCDKSPWKGDHYAAVTKKVPGASNVTISGTFLTRVFEGPFQEAKNWHQEMHSYVESKGKKAKKIYFFYTTCPKCIKVYKKNYVVAFAQI